MLSFALTALNRYCITNTSLPETEDNRSCGPCFNGTIEDFTAPDDVEFPYCIAIDDITEENFRRAFGEAIELNNMDIAARLVIIYAVATFVSEQSRRHSAIFPDVCRAS